MTNTNPAIRAAEIVWGSVEPCRVTSQEAVGGRKRIVFGERALDGCPSKGAVLREFEAFSLGKGPVLHAEYEITDLEPQMPSAQNYRFATVRLLTEGPAAPE